MHKEVFFRTALIIAIAGLALIAAYTDPWDPPTTRKAAMETGTPPEPAPVLTDAPPGHLAALTRAATNRRTTKYPIDNVIKP